MNIPERILCSAIKVENVSEQYDHIYLGLRHTHCFAEMKRIRDLLDDTDEVRVQTEQGFLTTKNRFVDRKEAMKIAREEGQVIQEYGNGEELYSKCLY